MSTIDHHATGTCAWVELFTPDAEAASRFYTALFGWEVFRSPMGPDSWYDIFRLGGRDVAAAFTMTPAMLESGISPHWFTYFATGNADETASKAVTLGGTVLKPPFDVHDVGRMAAIGDPQGAVFGLWQPKSHQGIACRDEPGTLCWNELMTPDAEGAVRFYAGLFGHGHQTVPMQGMTYHLLLSGERPMAGVVQITTEMGPVRPNWLTYFHVADCDAAARRVAELGGQVTIPPTTVPEAGRFAVAIDSQGTHFAILTPPARG